MCAISSLNVSVFSFYVPCIFYVQACKALGSHISLLQVGGSRFKFTFRVHLAVVLESLVIHGAFPGHLVLLVPPSFQLPT